MGSGPFDGLRASDVCKGGVSTWVWTLECLGERYDADLSSRIDTTLKGQREKRSHLLRYLPHASVAVASLAACLGICEVGTERGRVPRFDTAASRVSEVFGSGLQCLCDGSFLFSSPREACSDRRSGLRRDWTEPLPQKTEWSLYNIASIKHL